MIAMAVVIFGLWNVPVVRKLLNPLKLFTIGLHELFHIFLTILSGGRILKVTIDPQLGGATIVEGGVPGLILPAGYLGSTMMGACFVLGGFDTLIAKIMSFVLAVGLIAPLSLVRDKLTILLTLIYEALLIGFWFVDHASALRWLCLLVGIMKCVIPFCAPLFVNTLAAVYSMSSVRTYFPTVYPPAHYRAGDVADDRFFHKANDSDATQFSLLFPSLSAHIWALLWILFEMGTLVGFIMIGLITLKVCRCVCLAKTGSPAYLDEFGGDAH
ncbi:peptidase M50B-like-domain-containing protein [Schizophyllum amplum]|uniref:Peptidase M50B-like-domain-containing protein n=1 Tax=Schizophyllum amplum TaxID=97359 RepID=A0A550CKK3_9AGAR|nr:peptidase M50B-like-domain-containing protein [Auriculariopsis ampla]